MRASYFAAALAIITPLVSARPASQPDVDAGSQLRSAMHNITERTYYGGSSGSGSSGSSYSSKWTYDKCDQISGTTGWGSYKVKFDLGCVCLSDVDDFCDSNDLSDWVGDWIKNYLQNAGNFRYPTGGQPTCDDRGGYTCPNGKSSDGTCSSQAAISCGDGRCLQSDGRTCCPRGTYLMGGKCCAKTCSGSQGKCVGSATCPSGQVLSGLLCCPSGWTGYQKTCCPSGQSEDPSNLGTCICNDASQKVDPSNSGKCISKCSSGLVWKTSMCCKSYQSEVSGKCGCADASYTDTGSACNLKCTDQQTYNSNTGRCDNKCASGYTWSNSARNPSGMCCEKGNYCQQTICCPTGQEETNGKCCAVGSIYKNGRCQAPSGKKKRQALAGVSHQQPLDKTTLNLDEKLCPKGLSACPIPGGATGQYECLDSFNDLQSCGGCASLGKGKDCTAIPGARWMGCEAGSCVVYNCRPGWKLAGDSSCIKA